MPKRLRLIDLKRPMPRADANACWSGVREYEQSFMKHWECVRADASTKERRVALACNELAYRPHGKLLLGVARGPSRLQ